MAASLKGIDPELKKYLKSHRLPDVYEALLSALAIMCPDDPHQFIVDTLRHLQQHGLADLNWDSFIEESMRPKVKLITESNLEYIFNFDENLQPTPEMYETAYEHYNMKLKSTFFNGWMQYHLRKQKRRQELERNMARAELYHRHRIFRIRLQMWINWFRFRKGRQSMAYNIIRHIYNVSMGRIIFEAWRNVTLDAKRTREYFEITMLRLERGENMEDEDGFGKGSGEARDDISMLPRKVAIKIFTFLDLCDLANCASVCRSWKVITQSSALWSRLNLSKVRHRATDHAAVRLLSKCRPYLVNLNLRGCSKITEKTFYSLRECRNLQDLNLSEVTSLNDDTMRLVAEGCKILLFLNVSHTQITDASLRVLAKNCVNLQYLSLAYCSRFSDKGLAYLANGKGAKKLTYLDMSGCLQVTSEGFLNLAEGCVNLQHLTLNDLITLDDLCMQNLTEQCKFAKSVSFLGSPNLSDESFRMLSSSKKLQKIKIEGNQKMTDLAFKHICRTCPDLRLVYMTDCQRITDMTLKALANCRNLTVLNLADCVRISDTGVRYIVESSCGPKLRELNLTNCVRVSDMGLVQIHKKCHNLVYLSVCFCEHISEAGIELLGNTHTLVSLDISGCNCGDLGLSALGNNTAFKDVSISECVGITDLGLQKFAQQCTEIEYFDVSYCQLLTDSAIKNLAFCCRMLTVLNLAGCKALTDLTVQYLSGVCHYLRQLDMSGCYFLTDKSLKYLKKGCKRLQVLTILYCRNITKSSAQKMMKYVKKVEYSEDEAPPHFNYF